MERDCLEWRKLGLVIVVFHEDEGTEHGDHNEISGKIYAEYFSERSEKKSRKIGGYNGRENQRTYSSDLR